MLTILGVYLLIALAAGRLTYLIVHDEITRPIREWIWLRSAPEGATIRLIGGEGDTEVPARMMHVVARDADGDMVVMDARSPREVVGFIDAKYSFQPQHAMRKPGFFGSLVECPYCVSFWIALALFILHEVWFRSVFKIDAPLAVWAVANWVAVKALG